VLSYETKNNSLQSKTKSISEKLRKNSTLSEILLWKYLKGKQMKSYDFHRQKPLNNYIVDFFYNELMLAIEIDGDSHAQKQVFDFNRQRKLESLGIRFLRFYGSDVKNDIEGVLQVIEIWIEKHENNTNTPLNPLSRGDFNVE